VAVVTRADEAGEPLGMGLAARGFHVLHLPVMRIESAADSQGLTSAVRRLSDFDWVVVASANGARALGEALQREGLAWLAGEGAPRVCAVGPATAGALEEEGIPVALVPARFVAEGVLESMDRQGGLAGLRILIPRPPEARDVLTAGFRERGAVVEEVEAYRNVPDPEGLRALRAVVGGGEVDLLTLTSGSAARRVAEAMGGLTVECRVAAIGPATAEAAREVGLPVDAVADPHTVEGLLQVCTNLFAPGAPRED